MATDYGSIVVVGSATRPANRADSDAERAETDEWMDGNSEGRQKTVSFECVFRKSCCEYKELVRG
jgi:hypothetical protein